MHIGYSSGGLTASSILSKLWQLPYFSGDILRQNVVCIIFGITPIGPQHIQALEENLNIFRSSCHVFLLEGHIHVSLYMYIMWSIPLFISI